MVKNRQAATIPGLSFKTPAGGPAGLEVMTLAQLRTRMDIDHLAAPRRPSFHHLIHPTRGTLRHTVDFATYTAASGSWLWVRPGQVQQWADLRGVEGTLVLFEADFLDQATGAAASVEDPHAPVLRAALAEDQQALSASATHLAAVFAATGRWPVDVHLAVLRHLLAALLLQLAHVSAPAGRPRPEPNETFLRFRDAVEHGFTRSRRVEDYARQLRYSARTLSRATTAAAGVNAKEFIDRRSLLEAKRLLAHTDDTAAQIALRLGFSSPTNFSKYFQQRAGMTPIRFRDTVRGTTELVTAAG